MSHNDPLEAELGLEVNSLFEPESIITAMSESNVNDSWKS